ncbi:hypothetical protein O0L34_g14552 [Tuta absoluta]|nr:hypothetical protein O0L34_g14552 [Tuta absoluta]
MDWQLTCRVCLETGDMVSLFDWDENNEQLGDKYTYCCGIEVSKNDSLPTLICLNCVDRLTFSYQFKQQCLSSNETLKECLEEFEKSSQQVSTSASTSKPTETETITIKQENGLLLQYELPVEHDPANQWSLASKSNPVGAVVTKAPGAKKRGRPRKYPNEQGQIDISPYHRKKPKATQKEEESLTSLLASGSLDLKQEPGAVDDDDDEPFGGDFPEDDPDFNPAHDSEVEEKKTPKKRGRPRKTKDVSPKKEKKDDDDGDNGEDVLLQETIMAISEPIPDHILNPKPKKKYPYKKKYNYEKTHTCETCGASFTSNASLQAHIRRHLGIKPFVCSVCGYSCVMNEELKRHMLRHTGERPYKCRICDRRFGDYGTRQKHERLHMGLRPYQCTLCSKSFTYSYVLSNHMLTHTGEKKFS